MWFFCSFNWNFYKLLIWRRKLSDNITCNPYSKRKLDKVKCGLIQSDDTNDKKGNLVYLVNILPQSLIYFNLGSINEEDEKKYKKALF